MIHQLLFTVIILKLPTFASGSKRLDVVVMGVTVGPGVDVRPWQGKGELFE